MIENLKNLLNNKFLLFSIANTILVITLLIINFLFFKEAANIFVTINILGVIMLALPIIAIKYMEYRKVKVMEETFPNFLRDFVESVRGGLMIKDTMKALAKNDYKELNPSVKTMAAQLDWGIPVESVLVKFGQSTNSPFIRRIISSVVESHRFGGNLTDTLEALCNASINVENLKAERGNYLYSQVTTGYIIFFAFLGIIIMIGKFLIPSLAKVSLASLTTAAEVVQPDLSLGYKDLFRSLILLQGFFAGLSVGKMAEGSMISGIKHSLIMIFTGLIVFVLFG